MSRQNINNSQIEELVDRAMQPEDELLPLMMPEAPAESKTANSRTDNAAAKDDEEEEISKKSTRQVLMTALTEQEDEKIDFSLPHVLRGDILTCHWLRQQIWWLVMLVVMAFFYVSNRYYAQKQLIKNNHLKEELKETHYDAMARSSQLMRNCRRSIIVDKLADAKSTLAMPERQPAVVME